MRTKIFSLIIVLLISFISYSSPILACEPYYGDPWFKLDILFETSNLPTGVSIKSGSDSYYTSEGEIKLPRYIFANSSSTPFYILTTLKLPEPSVSLPEGAANTERPTTTYKLVSDQVFFTYLKRTPENVNSSSFKWQSTDLKVLSFAYYDIDDYSGLVVDYRSGDDRPKNVEIPKTQDFSIPAMYGDKQIDLKGKITYELNDKYNPKAHANDQCSRHLDRVAWEAEFTKKHPTLSKIVIPIRNHWAEALLYIFLPIGIIAAFVAYMVKKKK